MCATGLEARNGVRALWCSYRSRLSRRELSSLRISGSELTPDWSFTPADGFDLGAARTLKRYPSSDIDSYLDFHSQFSY